MAIVEQPRLRYTYVHVDGCKAVTMVGREAARRLQTEPDEIDDLYCSGCRERRPIEQFAWADAVGDPSEERVCPPRS